MGIFFCIALAFCCGFSVMTVELSAVRLISPFFGSSNYIWTNIIGVILASLSIGYYIGGKLADRRPKIETLSAVLVFCAAVLLVIPFIAKIVCQWFLPGSDELPFDATFGVLFWGSLFVTIVLFLPPTFFLAFASPFLIKLVSVRGRNVGHASGLIFAFSTLGGILGTFMTTHFLIPTLGTRITFFFAAAVILVPAIWGLGFRRRIVPFLICLLGCICIAGCWAFARHIPIRDNPLSILEEETPYQFVQVLEKEKVRFLTINESSEAYSSVYRPGSALTGGYYYDYFNLLPYLLPSLQRIDSCILGFGCGVWCRQLKEFFSTHGSVSIDGVEIDPRILALGKSFFGLDDASQSILNAYNLDGRVFLASSRKKYNLLFIDVYQHQFYIPFHMATREFFQMAWERLEPGGILGLNLSAFSRDTPIFTAMVNTLCSVFHCVWGFPLRGSSNLLLFAIKGKTELPPLEDRFRLIDPRLKNLYEETFLPYLQAFEFDEKEVTFSDDWAPVARLIDETLSEKHRKYMEILK